MKLPKEAIEELKQMYDSDMNTSISYKEAEKEANNLIEFFLLIYR